MGLIVDGDLGVGESGGEDLFDDGFDVGAIAAEFSGLLEAVDDGCVHAQRSHDEERVIVAEGDIDAAGFGIELELLEDPRWFAGHVEGVADEVGGSGAAVLEGDFGLCEQGEEMMDGAVAADDDESIGVVEVFCGGDRPPADIVLGEGVPSRCGELIDGDGEALCFAST